MPLTFLSIFTFLHVSYHIIQPLSQKIYFSQSKSNACSAVGLVFGSIVSRVVTNFWHASDSGRPLTRSGKFHIPSLILLEMVSLVVPAKQRHEVRHSYMVTPTLQTSLAFSSYIKCTCLCLHSTTQTNKTTFCLRHSMKVCT